MRKRVCFILDTQMVPVNDHSKICVKVTGKSVKVSDKVPVNFNGSEKDALTLLRYKKHT